MKYYTFYPPEPNNHITIFEASSIGISEGGQFYEGIVVKSNDKIRRLKKGDPFKPFINYCYPCKEPNELLKELC